MKSRVEKSKVTRGLKRDFQNEVKQTGRAPRNVRVILGHDFGLSAQCFIPPGFVN